MARTLGLARQKVAYHVRQLEEHGFVELVREQRRREHCRLAGIIDEVDGDHGRTLAE